MESARNPYFTRILRKLQMAWLRDSCNFGRIPCLMIRDLKS
jgi:hypothetical protein